MHSYMLLVALKNRPIASAPRRGAANTEAASVASGVNVAANAGFSVPNDRDPIAPWYVRRFAHRIDPIRRPRQRAGRRCRWAGPAWARATVFAPIREAMRRCSSGWMARSSASEVSGTWTAVTS
jgi:hypothetical protein